MRQVPASNTYLIVGDGRLARHLRHFFDLESISYSHWSRKTSDLNELPRLSSQATHVCLAISDRAIDEFILAHPWLLEKKIVHFSGALVHPKIPSAHPLMTFGHDLYELETYRAIPFILEDGRGTFEDLLPGLKNSSFTIQADKKALYHAWCVMTGNFTTLLWEEGFREFGNLGLPKNVLLPFLAQTTWNLASSRSGESVLTGPLARADRETIARNLQSLGETEFARLYRAFVEVYEARKRHSQAKKDSTDNSLGHSTERSDSTKFSTINLSSTRSESGDKENSI